jgi:hypothetical protein
MFSPFTYIFSRSSIVIGFLTFPVNRTPGLVSNTTSPLVVKSGLPLDQNVSPECPPFNFPDLGRT